MHYLYHKLEVQQTSAGDWTVFSPGSHRLFDVFSVERAELEASGYRVKTPEYVSYFAYEMVPNGRLVLGRGKQVRDVYEVPAFQAVRGNPKQAHRLVNATREMLQRERPVPGWQWEAVCFGDGFDARSILYQSFDQALNAIDNALVTNSWLVTQESVRTRLIAGGDISLEAYSLLIKHNSLRQFEAILSEMVMSLHLEHKIKATVWCEANLHVEIIDGRLPHPLNARFGLSFDADRGRLLGDKGLCFYRYGYEELARRIHRGQAQCYRG